MNPGILRERGEILTLSPLPGENPLPGWEWKTDRKIWLSAKETGKKNLFSGVGVGAAGVDILMRETDLTLHNAIRWRGQHYFLTNIQEEGIHPVYYKVQAARITPKTVTQYRMQTEIGEYNRPDNEYLPLQTFPACITEKYVKSSDQDSHVETEAQLAAVTPKVIEAKAGDLFEIEGKKYRVMTAHLQDEFKNEYVIQRTEED